ncbi:MAG: permease-like cell division protein FtsX [Herbinix sp.]|nr:permease-like cell division protein FtsX [Herbinix sp.]
MKIFIYNIGYFLLEAKRTIRLNPLSNLFSVIGTGLILFLLGMVLAGWSVGDKLIVALKDEAEVSAYFMENTNEKDALKLVNAIKGMEGVMDASYIDETEAKAQMEKMLGNEADILGLFDENPFEAFIEVKINLDYMDQVLSDVAKLDGIDYVRDNRKVLEQMKGISDGLKLFGVLIMAAVGITTLIIISHMIRQGIYNNRDQINTLRLLGAPDGFIGFPFLLAGTFLTLLGGGLAAGLLILLLNEGYSHLSGFIPFIPLPSLEELSDKVSLLILLVSAALGLLGSLFGVSSIGKEE